MAQRLCRIVWTHARVRSAEFSTQRQRRQLSWEPPPPPADLPWASVLAIVFRVVFSVQMHPSWRKCWKIFLPWLAATFFQCHPMSTYCMLHHIAHKVVMMIIYSTLSTNQSYRNPKANSCAPKMMSSSIWNTPSVLTISYTLNRLLMLFTSIGTICRTKTGMVLISYTWHSDMQHAGGINYQMPAHLRKNTLRALQSMVFPMRSGLIYQRFSAI